MRTTLEITTKISKCMGCHFCPQDKLSAAYAKSKNAKATMSVGDFVRILATVPITTEVHFSGMGECFLNPECGLMIEHASEVGYPIHIYSTLVGLTQRQVESVNRSRINYFRVHAPDTKGFIYPTDKWLEFFERFCRTKIPFSVMTMGELEPDLLLRFKALGIKFETPEMLSRAGNLWKDRDFKGPITCAAERYHSNVVFPNGEVVGCCHLYSREIVLGNLLTEPYDNIWHRAEDWANDKNPPDDSPCRKCSWAKPI